MRNSKPTFLLLIALPVLTFALILSQTYRPVDANGSPLSQETKSSGAEMTEAATAFVASLSEEQKKTTVLDYDSDKRVGWHFIPKDSRKGFQWKHMSNEQKKLAGNLLKSSLGAAGLKKAKTIMQLEGLLHAIEKGKGNIRDPERYYYTLFGSPSADSKWGLSIEGHHLSLNFVVQNNELVSATPSFFAANPGVVKTDIYDKIKKGTRVLANEEVLAFKLVNSLNEDQKSKAIFAEKAPREIRAAGEAQPPQANAIGISGKDLTAEQKKILRKLVGSYAENFTDATRKQKLSAIRANGWKNLHFAWAGATKPGVGHYYRIQGESVLIEFVNTQPDAQGNPANHIHCVWRNPGGDFAIEISK